MEFINIYKLIDGLEPGKCHLTGGNEIKFFNRLPIRSKSYIEIKYRMFFGIVNRPILEIINNNVLLKENLIWDTFEYDNQIIRSDKKLLLIFLTIGDSSGNELIGAHANLIIINNDEKTIERFDPNGGNPLMDDGQYLTYTKIIDKYIKEFFMNDNIYKEYTYISPLDYCLIGPQQKIGSQGCPPNEKTGFCGTLSVLYGLLRILNPNYSRDEIIKHMDNYTVLDLRKFVTFAEQVIE
jgi:hypothetical protein